MENKQLQPAVNPNKLINYTPKLATLLTKVSEPTKEILIARHSGLMFRDMGAEKLLLSAKKLLADLNVLTGILLPEDEAFSQLSIFLAESLKQDYEFMTVPLILQAFKKQSHILTAGKDKSYGRLLSLADIHLIMDAYGMPIVKANEEIDRLLQEDAAQTILTEEEKQNIIRQGIQQQLKTGNFNCTYADFNQLQKDGLLTLQSLVKQGWNGLQNLKQKYTGLLNSVIPNDADDAESLKDALQARNYREKLSLIIQIEDEIKGEVAGLFLQHCKANNKNIYL